MGLYGVHNKNIGVVWVEEGPNTSGPGDVA